MRVLVVGLNYTPEPVGIGPYTAELAQGLARRDHAVHVIAGKPYYPQWRAYPGHTAFGWSRALENGVNVFRCPHYIPARPNGGRRIVHHLSFALAALPVAVREARRHRPRVVLCVAPSLLSVPVARLAARAAGARLWIHVQDFEVEAAFATGLVRQRGWLARLARGMESRLLRSAARVSTISPQMAARLPAKGVPAERVREVRNWANAVALDAAPDGAAFRREWSLGERNVALYSGNIANKQGIEVLVDAARRLAGRSDIVFVICGPGPNRVRLETLAAGLDNVRFQDLQPAERLGELLKLAGVHLLPQVAGAADLVLPSKLTNILASGRPVVATAEPGTGLHAEVEGCGLAVPPGDAEALANAVERLVDDPDLARRLGEQGRLRASERWDREAILNRLDRELVELAGEQR